MSTGKVFTLDDIKEAYEDGYYEGAGDGEWIHEDDLTVVEETINECGAKQP